jgi:hypothetical protein
MSWQAPRTQEARHRGVLRKGLRLAGHVGAVGMVLAASWAIAADAPAPTSKPTPVQGAVLVPPVGMTGASGVVAVPPRGDMPPRLQMSGPAVTANKAANGGVLSLPVVAPATPAAAPGAVEFVTHGRFRDVPVYKPKGEIRSVVLMLSGDLGWTPAASRMAESLAQQGALVAGLSTPALFASLEADPGDCAFPDGDLENFSRFLQAYEKVPGYYPPILVGDNEGGALAYAMIAQARPNIFAGAMSMEFCPVLELRQAARERRGGAPAGHEVVCALGGAAIRHADVVCAPLRSAVRRACHASLHRYDFRGAIGGVAGHGNGRQCAACDSQRTVQDRLRQACRPAQAAAPAAARGGV